MIHDPFEKMIHLWRFVWASLSPNANIDMNVILLLVLFGGSLGGRGSRPHFHGRNKTKQDSSEEVITGKMVIGVTFLHTIIGAIPRMSWLRLSWLHYNRPSRAKRCER